MKELFLEVFSDIDLDGYCEVPLETVLALFTVEYCDTPSILITFVLTTKNKNNPSFKIKISNVLFELIERNDLNLLASLCKLPVFIAKDGTICVSGICATLRHIVKAADPLHPLLGFKQSCLYACAESSIWTKFCEIDMINTVKKIVSITHSDNLIVPEDVLRFENHMLQPVRIHNIQKHKQDYAKTTGHKSKSNLPDSRLDLIQELDHIYAEGPEVSLADIILFPCVHIILQTIGSVFLKEHIPLTFKWYETLLGNDNIKRGLKMIVSIERIFSNDIYVSYVLPEVENQSLYKRDTKRYKPRNRIYTKQEDIDASMVLVNDINLTILRDENTFGHEVEFDWGSVPFDAQPEGGQLPQKRVERKAQQLENLTKAVLKIAQNGYKIVDFCSGSGHLGLILAHFLPRCTVILLENKEQSLDRARERAQRLKLSNIAFCQCNLDYFCADFDIGVSLHACGVATDLVIERCIQQRASFISCPCCYGSIQSNHMIEYPRSKLFKNSALSFRDYLVLGHGADQTHDENNVKTDQGNKCMTIIDSDRLLRAKEVGYIVSLSKLRPVSCTPKNNLLVGLPLR